MNLRLKTVVLTALCVLVVSSVRSNASFSFDIDGDGNKDALTDGLLVLRHLFGFSGSTLSEGAVGSDATRSDATALESHLETNAQYLDIDGDGQNDALTDGLLLLRLLSLCARRKLRCSSDMLQNTAGNGRCEHLLFSEHRGFFSRGLKMPPPWGGLKSLQICLLSQNRTQHGGF